MPDRDRELKPEEEVQAPPSPWYAYVLWSDRLRRSYVGITTDVLRRFAQHQGLKAGGARATRAGRPWTLAACYGPFADRSEASKAEHLLRKRRGRARFTHPTLPALPPPEAG